MVRPWPWFSHRTLAEVDETERLLADHRRGWKFNGIDGPKAVRLYRLLDMRDRANPGPPEETGECRMSECRHCCFWSDQIARPSQYTGRIEAMCLSEASPYTGQYTGESDGCSFGKEGEPIDQETRS